MRKISISISAVTVVAAAVIGAVWKFRLSSAPARTASGNDKSTPPSVLLADKTEVFQKAFWKRPGPLDEIMHAERREWLGDAGVSRWQWFLVVRPSPELLRHVKEDNVFSLRAVPGIAVPSQAPEWFPTVFENATCFQSASGSMKLVFSNHDEWIYATDEGGGFQAGAPEAKPMEPGRPAQTGRLPAVPPPGS
jgi:hypothetical protein